MSPSPGTKRRLIDRVIKATDQTEVDKKGQKVLIVVGEVIYNKSNRIDTGFGIT